MWWIIAIIILLIILIYLLFAPFFVELDSNNDLYRIRFHRLVSVQIILKETSVFLKLKVAWWKKEFNLMEPRKRKRKPEVIVEKKKKRGRSINFSRMFERIKAVVKTFKVNRFRIMIDTHDMPLNGILYPWFYLLSRVTGKTILINFWGENEINVQIENNIARMLWAYVKS